MAYHFIFHLFFLIPFLQFHHCQSQSLFTLQTLLNTFNASSTTTYCTATTIAINLPPVTLVCYDNTITQLHITGNNNNKVYDQNVSTESFFSAISSIFPSLKVLSLVSLTLNGPLPATVLANALSSLEILNISSNHFHGSIPFELSFLKNLQTLVFDHNNFTGQVPSWLGNSLPALTVLSFKNNSLDGSLPVSLSQLVDLRVLDLSTNQLSGEVPVEFRNLTNLQVLDLEGNRFGPSFPVLHNRLTVLVLKGNKFGYGVRSDDLRSFYQLRKLDLSSNEFNGPFPDFLFSLTWLAYLNISRNKFSGKLSKNVSCSDELVFVDFSFNRFTGELPSCMQRLETKSIVYGGNCLSNVHQKQQENVTLCHNQALAVMIEPRGRVDGGSSKSKVRVVVVTSVVGVVFLGGVAVFVAIRSGYFGAARPQIRVLLDKVSPAYTIKMLTDARYISETMKLGGVGIPAYRTYVLGELIEATNNFHSSTFLPNASHAQLYKGELSDGTMIAIRHLKMRRRCTIQSCTRKIELVSKLRHPNLVNPIGHCFDRYPEDPTFVRALFLMFEFVPNGTLRASLSGRKLTWTQRLAAAIGISKGMQFLHTRITPRIFSNNLKITNVLLDQSFHVKISSYNLPFLSETKVANGYSVTGSNETLGKLRFEIEDTDHDHVYDLGVILLELIMGREIDCINDTDLAKDMLQVSLATDDIARRSIVDPLIRKECCDESLKSLMELCMRCLSKDSPSIDDVLWNLEVISQAHVSSMEDLMGNQMPNEATIVCITEKIE